ncbi:hypothetical protein LEMLEM_LOCUS26513 [Lemmus lemmus]
MTFKKTLPTHKQNGFREYWIIFTSTRGSSMWISTLLQ